MAGEMEFDFTDAELFEAIRLTTSDAEARQHVEAFRAAWKPGMDWAASHDLLLLLSIASPTGRQKVDRLRKEGQEARLRSEMRSGGPALTDAELTRRVSDAVAAEDRRWREQRSERRRALQLEGKSLPDEP